MKIKPNKLGTKKSKLKTKAAKGSDKLAAARAAKKSGVRRAKRGDGLPDPKKMRELHLKYKNEIGAKLLTTSKVVGYFKSVGQGIRVSKEDVLSALSDEVYGAMFSAMVRALRNNRKTVRSFDVR